MKFSDKAKIEEEEEEVGTKTTANIISSGIYTFSCTTQHKNGREAKSHHLKPNIKNKIDFVGTYMLHVPAQSPSNNNKSAYEIRAGIC